MKRNQKLVKSAWGSTWTCIWWTSWCDADEQISDLYEPEIQIRETATQMGLGLGAPEQCRQAQAAAALPVLHTRLFYSAAISHPILSL